jgi:hypothetical protein
MEDLGRHTGERETRAGGHQAQSPAVRKQQGQAASDSRKHDRNNQIRGSQKYKMGQQNACRQGGYRQ